ncbi:MAG: hypothetical protein LBR62_01365 [Puniceicoccales bacterium]|jgi:hypothetical protein|nr:hypothetical protein [Puniceicoccales bacterium]
MGEEPRYWNEWVDIKGVEDFVSDVLSGLVSKHYGESYEKIIPERIHNILKSAGAQGPETEMTAYWFLSNSLLHVDMHISCILLTRLNEKTGTKFPNLVFCKALCQYYEKSADVRALIKITYLLESLPPIEAFQPTIAEIYEKIIPIMQEKGLGFYVLNRLMKEENSPMEEIKEE